MKIVLKSGATLYGNLICECGFEMGYMDGRCKCFKCGKEVSFKIVVERWVS